MYTNPLCDRVTGYANVTTRQLLDHLYKTYGRINHHTLATNDQKFREPYNSTDPIEALFNCIELCMDIADSGKTSYTGEQVLSNTINIIYQTGVYELPCKEWHNKTATYKTWNNFKLHFAEAHNELRNTPATATNLGYAGHMNTQSQMEMANYIEDNHKTPDNPTLKSLVDSLKTLTFEIKSLKQNTNKKSTSRSTSLVENGTYCWTHGFFIGASHTSATCRSSKPGHRSEATAYS